MASRGGSNENEAGVLVNVFNTQIQPGTVSGINGVAVMSSERTGASHRGYLVSLIFRTLVSIANRAFSRISLCTR